MRGRNKKGKITKPQNKKGKDFNKAEKAEDDKPALPPVPYFSLFRYASTGDKILLFIATCAAIGSGFSQPLLLTFFGRIANTLVRSQATSEADRVLFCKGYWSTETQGTNTINASVIPKTLMPPFGESTFLDEIRGLAVTLVYIALATMALGYIFISAFNIASENMVHRIRILYLQALLRQNVGWHDTVQDKNFVSRTSEDLIKVQEATGEKIGFCILFAGTFILCMSNAFWHGWKLTLVALCSAPVLYISQTIVSRIQSRVAATEQDSYAKAGTVAQEAITNIKTVMAFSGAKKEVQKYEDGLADSVIAGKRKGSIDSFGMGLMWFIVFASYALAFWYGTTLILQGRQDTCNGRNPEYDAETMTVVFFSVLMGAGTIGQAAVYFATFATGKAAAATIFSIIERIPEIDSYSEAGKKPAGRAHGNIEFKNLDFSYPSRPDIQILKKFSLTVNAGQTVALVGHSGCGKSTCIQLLQRFYDPLSGSVSLDGTDIKDLHIGWLRSQVGVVSQEPILFNTTISENIRYGRDDVTDKEIEDACRQSNAHVFINKLPNKYETLVGDRGAALSGGQKQRIAIARALVKNPAILLLDEATSALDTQSESIVQHALDKARQGRTTLIVAHRLSTIRNADVVVAINEGQVSEKGTHHELLEQKGLYHALVLAQMQGRGEDIDALADEVVDDPSVLDRKMSMDSNPRGSIVSIEDEQVPVIVHDDSLSEKELAKQATLSRLFKLSRKDWPCIFIGISCCALQGSVMPIYAIIFGDVLQTLSEPDEKIVEEDASRYALYFLGLAVVAGVSAFLQGFMFNLAGVALTQRLRKMTFQAMLQQELGWFDEPNNNIGSMCARLAGDASSVQGATGTRIGIYVQAVSTIAIATGIAMYFNVKLGSVALAFVPFVIATSYYQQRVMFGVSIGEKKAAEESSNIAVQAVANIRTVASLCMERRFVRTYSDIYAKSHRDTFKMNNIRGLLFGFSQAVPFFAYAVIKYYGGWLVENEGLPYGDVFKVSQALILGTTFIGQVLAFGPNYNRMKISAARILGLLDRRPKIENSIGVGLQIRSSHGGVGFDSVAFHYPTRPSAQILKSLSMHVEPGNSVAFVGPSGCGKSTAIQLILRFYDPLTGRLTLDDQEIAALNVDALRSQMAIVDQDSALFDRTIADNIAYGDNSRTVPMVDIISAAKMANIHSFISQLPLGYDTRVGEMGSLLSGGQKQRVAIARALVRNPKFLLLDEATSALDTENEQVVQAALGQASSGRTSITIAHRLSSIQNVDTIIVINHGVVVEAGTHNELLTKRGLYNRLWNMNMQGKGTTSNST